MRDRGATVVLVTHFMEEAEALCDRIAIVDAGRVIALDTPRGLAAAAGDEVRVTFTGDGTDPGFLSAVAGVRSVTVDADRVVTVLGTASTPVPLAAALDAHQLNPTDFRTHHPSLEDAFLALTGVALSDEETS